MNIFEEASRQKLRFPSPKGLLTVEDLWDLPLTSNTGKANLDWIACTLHAELENQPKTSFVVKNTSPIDKLGKLSLDVVVHIIEVRLAENEQKKQLENRREQKQQLLTIIAQKEAEQLHGTSLDELRARVAALD